MALQQGGLGLLLSPLIVMAPPIAAAFFQGTLGKFASYNSFGSIGADGGYAAAQQARAREMQPQETMPANDNSKTAPQRPTASLGSFSSQAASTPAATGAAADVNKFKNSGPSGGTNAQ